MKKILILLVSIALVSSFSLMSCKKKEAPVTEEIVKEQPAPQEEQAVPEVKEEGKEPAPTGAGKEKPKTGGY